ncbi:MAG TPA: HD domain-containing protein [Verrucomicrobiae bacterium]|jgi:exopolyphosphatase/guanosine-5'-triphosphate,3'-diphosphate pyrophosphatase
MNDAVRRQEFLTLMQRLETEPSHVLQVAALSLRLFDDLLPLHGLGPDERLLLEAAACLHDIGWSVVPDGKGHHKESARLISEHPWESWPASDIALIAMIARHHRKSPPGAEHEDYMALPPADQHRVRHLAALLRVGDALDRSHTQRIQHVEAVIQADTVTVRLASARPIDAELKSLQKKGDLAETMWQRRIQTERIKLAAAV